MKKSIILLNKVFFIFFVNVLIIFININSCKNSKADFKKFAAFLGDDKSNPRILVASPGNGDKNLPRTQKLSVIFSKPMNINACIQSFSTLPNNQGFFEFSDYSLIFSPSVQWNYGTYTFTITKNCEDKDGRDLNDLYSANFTIGDSSNAGVFPKVLSMTTGAGTVAECTAATASQKDFFNSQVTDACMGNASVNKVIINFSTAMNKTLTQGAIALSPSTTYSTNWTSDSSLELNFDKSLVANERYTLIIASSAADALNIKLEASVSGTFKVGSTNLVPYAISMNTYQGTIANCSAGAGTLVDFYSTSVINACVGNNLVTPIVINFSHSMDTASTQTATTISPSLAASFAWSNNNSTLTITPDSYLTYGNRYTVTVGTGAKSAANNSVLTPITASFIAGGNTPANLITTIQVRQGTLANCNASAGTLIDIVANSISNGCVGNPTVNPIILNFNSAMDTTVTQNAISISPTTSGTFVWSGANQILTFTPDSKLTYGTRYEVTLSTLVRSTQQITQGVSTKYSFVVGAVITSPEVQAFGVASQAGCSTTSPGVGNAAGGNWTLGTCYWDNSMAILTASSYQFRGGDDGSGSLGSNLACADVNTDNFRIIFNSYMDINTVIPALSFKRLSPPSTTILIASYNWQDCQGVYPFGCRVLNLIYSEQEASCNGTSFGSATTNGDFNLLRSDNAPANYPFYQLTVDTSAKDVNGVALSKSFIIALEAK